MISRCCSRLLDLSSPDNCPCTSVYTPYTSTVSIDSESTRCNITMSEERFIFLFVNYQENSVTMLLVTHNLSAWQFGL